MKAFYNVILSDQRDQSGISATGSGDKNNYPTQAKSGLEWGTRNHVLNDSLLHEQLIQHEVDDDAGDADVHPEREGPARNRPVQRVAGPQCARERDQHQRHDDNGQDRMAQQDREIERARPAVSLKQNVSDVGVIVEVRSEERRRGAERGQHYEPVGSHLFAPDKVTPYQQEHGAGAIEQSIQCGKRTQFSLHGQSPGETAAQQSRSLSRARYLGQIPHLLTAADMGHRPQAAGFVVRRLAMKKANPNMIAVNTAKIARLAPIEKSVAVPGKSRARNTSVP